LKNIDEKIKRLVASETEKIRKRKPFLEKINITYEEYGKGYFLSKLKAKTKNKIIFVKKESRCPEVAVRKVLNVLTKRLQSKKFKKAARISFDFKETA